MVVMTVVFFVFFVFLMFLVFSGLVMPVAVNIIFILMLYSAVSAYGPASAWQAWGRQRHGYQQERRCDTPQGIRDSAWYNVHGVYSLKLYNDIYRYTPPHVTLFTNRVCRVTAYSTSLQLHLYWWFFVFNIQKRIYAGTTGYRHCFRGCFLKYTFVPFILGFPWKNARLCQKE